MPVQGRVDSTDTYQNALFPYDVFSDAESVQRKKEITSCHVITCSATMDTWNMQRVNERRRAFPCIGFRTASTVAGPHGPGFVPMGIFERMCI
jgi:hypothetical protein